MTIQLNVWENVKFVSWTNFIAFLNYTLPFFKVVSCQSHKSLKKKPISQIKKIIKKKNITNSSKNIFSILTLISGRTIKMY